MTSARIMCPAGTICGEVQRYFIHWWTRRCSTLTHQQAGSECSPRRRRRTCVLKCMRHVSRNLQIFLDPVSSSYAVVLNANKKELYDKKFSPEDRKRWNESDVKELNEWVKKAGLCESCRQRRKKGFRSIKPLQHRWCICAQRKPWRRDASIEPHQKHRGHLDQKVAVTLAASFYVSSDI